MGSLKVMLTHYEVRDELRRLGADETTDAFWRVANTDALLREVGTACQDELRKLREENAIAKGLLETACYQLSKLTGEPWPPKPPEVK